jgi:hypothetical protein
MEKTLVDLKAAFYDALVQLEKAQKEFNDSKQALADYKEPEIHD